MHSANPALLHPAYAASNFMLREHVSTLCSHLHQCTRARSRWFGLAAIGEQIHALVAPRLISTVLGAASVLGLIALWN